MGRKWNDTQWKRIKNVSSFGEDFQKWWDSFQPEGRERDENGRFKQGVICELDWEPLEIVGKNGLWMAVAGLCFWGVAFQSETDRLASDEWHYAVADVTWALYQLMCPSRQLAASASRADPLSKSLPPSSPPKHKRKAARAEPEDEDEGAATRSSKRLRKTKDGASDEGVPTRATRSSAQ